MSQHYVSTQRDGENIEILLGWDRPLSGFFMVVSQQLEPACDCDPDGDLISGCEVKYFYSNLGDPELKHGFSNDPFYFKKKLVELNIEMPDEIFNIMLQDGLNNVGNAVRCYDLTDNVLLKS